MVKKTSKLWHVAYVAGTEGKKPKRVTCYTFATDAEHVRTICEKHEPWMIAHYEHIRLVKSGTRFLLSEQTIKR